MRFRLLSVRFAFLCLAGAASMDAQTQDPFVQVPIAIAANDIAYDPVRQRLVVAVSATPPGAHARSVAFVVPETGVVEATIPFASEPRVVTVTADGEYAYVGFRGEAVIRCAALALEGNLKFYRPGRAVFEGTVASVGQLPRQVAGILVLP